MPWLGGASRRLIKRVRQFSFIHPFRFGNATNKIDVIQTKIRAQIRANIRARANLRSKLEALEFDSRHNLRAIRRNENDAALHRRIGRICSPVRVCLPLPPPRTRDYNAKAKPLTPHRAAHSLAYESLRASTQRCSGAAIEFML